MKKTVVFIRHLPILGGIETLILRMSKWLDENGYRIIIISRESIHAYLKQSLINCHAEVVVCPRKNTVKNLHSLPISFSDGEEVMLIAFDYGNLLLSEQLRRLWPRNKIHVFFYPPQPYGQIGEYGHEGYPRLAYKLSGAFHKRYFKKLFRNKQIIFMDETQFFSAKTHYALKDDSFDMMIRLPMFLNPFNADHAVDAFKNEHFNVLTIGRISFPLKTYILYLVDGFSKAFRDNQKLRLTIIGSGEDENLLRKKIEEQPPEVQEAITCVGEVTYDRLNDYIDKANLYIGHGTTILDACNRGVPSVAVSAFVAECDCLGYFYKTPWNLSARVEALREEGMEISDELFFHEKSPEFYIREVMRMVQDEYLELCRKSHETIAKHYDVDNLMPLFLSYENKNTKPLNIFQITYIRVFRKFLRFAKNWNHSSQ